MPTEINGTTGVSQVQAGATSGGLPVFQCRAWVNFDGTRDSTGVLSTANTARLIRGSGNVSSVLRNGTGDYTVNFTTAMPDADYAVVGTSNTTTDYALRFGGLTLGASKLAGSVQIRTSVGASGSNAGFAQDQSNINIAIFR